MAELMLRSPSDYLVLDGGLATYLETQFGVNLKNTNLWSARILATNPELIERVHYDYAGEPTWLDAMSFITYSARFITSGRRTDNHHSNLPSKL